MVKFAIKIGGSVLLNANSYKNIAKEIEQISDEYSPDKLYIIVSASSGITDRLIHEVAKEQEEIILKKALNGECDFAKYNNPEVASRLLEGEIVSANILQSYLAQSTIISQNGVFPIVAEQSYLCANINMQESFKRKHLLEVPEQIVIVPGFGAVDLVGDKVLLGRNSSDLVAAMVAVLARVDKLIYVKNVSGIYTNFGQSNQELISHLSYEDAEKMRLGKVLDSRVIEILSNSKIDVIVGSHTELSELLKDKPSCGTRLLRGGRNEQ